MAFIYLGGHMSEVAHIFSETSELYKWHVIFHISHSYLKIYCFVSNIYYHSNIKR